MVASCRCSWFGSGGRAPGDDGEWMEPLPRRRHKPGHRHTAHTAAPKPRREESLRSLALVEEAAGDDGEGEPHQKSITWGEEVTVVDFDEDPTAGRMSQLRMGPDIALSGLAVVDPKQGVSGWSARVPGLCGLTRPSGVYTESLRTERVEEDHGCVSNTRAQLQEHLSSRASGRTHTSVSNTLGGRREQWALTPAWVWTFYIVRENRLFRPPGRRERVPSVGPRYNVSFRKFS